VNKYQTIGDIAVGRKNNYDFIRFIAASLVIYQHSFPLGAGSPNKDFITWITNGTWDVGAFGVAIFFVISGYLITQSYDNSKSFFKFVKARLLRIYPGLILSVLLCTFVLGPLVTTLSLKDYFYNTETYHYLGALHIYYMPWNLPGVFEHNAYKDSVNGSLWTIPFEMLCYGIVALLGFIGLQRYKLAMLAVFILNMLLNLFYPMVVPANGLQIFGLQVEQLSELFTYFSAGMVLYTFRHNIPMSKQFAMLSIIVLYLSTSLGIMKELFPIFGAYLVIYFSYAPIWKISSFSKYGDFSYGMYIFAFPVQQIITYLHGGKMSPVLNMLESFIVTLFIAMLSWHLVEKRALSLKNVQMISALLPNNGLFKNIYHRYLTSLDLILRSINWIKFLVLFLIIVVAYGIYNEKPTSVTFPYHKKGSIFKEGWLPQSPNEKYRWINKTATVELRIPSSSHLLRIAGFIPDNFTEVNQMNIYVNNQPSFNQKVKAGQGIDISIPIDSSFSDYNIKIEFNAAHKPPEGATDQRILSALISNIEFK
jgi:peptidoglycan/LPS O-acetylase OafA/YrhL